MAYNVEYQLQPLKCKPEPVSDEVRALIEESKNIDEIMPRPTAESVKSLLERAINSVENNPEGNDDMPEEVESEMDIN